MDTNGMVILHEDLVQNQEKERMSQQHIVNKVRAYSSRIFQLYKTWLLRIHSLIIDYLEEL